MASRYWRVAANVLNKRSRTADRGWSPTWWLGEELTTHRKNKFVSKCHTVWELWRAVVNTVVNLGFHTRQGVSWLAEWVSEWERLKKDSPPGSQSARMLQSSRGLLLFTCDCNRLIKGFASFLPALSLTFYCDKFGGRFDKLQGLCVRLFCRQPPSGDVQRTATVVVSLCAPVHFLIAKQCSGEGLNLLCSVQLLYHSD
jgi:hypothetical protein